MVRILRPIPVEQLKLLVFDLDGTLIDSAQDLCNSVNATLAHLGREPLPDAVVASYIGDGAIMLMRRALFGVRMRWRWTRNCWPRPTTSFSTTIASTSWTTPTPTKEFWRPWPRCASCTTHPDGPARLMAVLTNKPVRPAQAICEALGLAPLLPEHLWRQQLCHQEARSGGSAALMSEAGAQARRDGHDRRQPGGCGDGAQCGSLVDRLHLRPCAGEPRRRIRRMCWWIRRPNGRRRCIRLTL